MDFSQALRAVKYGEKVRREGWNGKGMYIFLVRIDNNLAVARLEPFIAMKTADDKFVPWLASQTDILADDWEVVN
jgi:hypothetical protein